MPSAAALPGSTSPPVIGRGEVVEEILEALDRAREGHGRCLLLIGPAGIGKSHLLQFAAGRAHERQFRVLVARALPDDLPEPFSLVRDLIRSAAPDEPLGGAELPGDPAQEAVPMALMPYLTVDPNPPPGPLASAVARSFTPDASERVLSALEAEGPEDSPALGRTELIARFAEFLKGEGRDHPLLVILDDLQFADASSLDVLLRLVPEVPPSRMAILASFIEGGETPDRSRPSLKALRESSGARTIVLRPFGPAEVGEFIRWIQGGTPPPESDILRWHAQTEGNPLFLQQVVRSTIGSSGTEPETAGLRDVADVLRARIAGLTDDERRLLSYAAVLGKEFAFADLVAAAGMTEERGTECLDRLVHQGLVRERGGEVYEFVSESVRTGVYSELTETRRRILHQKAGRALERRGGASDSDLARQFYLGRDDAKAVEYNVRAAQLALRAYAFDTAASHIARALEAERRRPDRSVRVEIRLLTQLGELEYELYNIHRSEEVLREAVRLGRAHSGHELELGRALLGLAQTRATAMSDYRSGAALANEAADILGRVGTAADLMAAHRILGSISWRLGRMDEAEAHQRVALGIAEKEGNPGQAGHLLIDLANTIVPTTPDRLAEALNLYARAAERFAAAEDHGSRARALMNRGATEFSAGRLEDALADLTLAIAAAERSRSPLWIGYCYLNLAQVEAERGNTTAARMAIERATAQVGSLGDRLASQQLAMAEGMVAEAEKAYEAAEQSYRSSLAQARDLGLAAEATEVLVRLARAATARGDGSAAERFLAEARSSGQLELRPDLVRMMDSLAGHGTAPPDPHP